MSWSDYSPEALKFQLRKLAEATELSGAILLGARDNFALLTMELGALIHGGSADSMARAARNNLQYRICNGLRDVIELTEWGMLTALESAETL